MFKKILGILGKTDFAFLVSFITFSLQQLWNKTMRVKNSLVLNSSCKALRCVLDHYPTVAIIPQQTSEWRMSLSFFVGHSGASERRCRQVIFRKVKLVLSPPKKWFSQLLICWNSLKTPWTKILNSVSVMK